MVNMGYHCGLSVIYHTFELAVRHLGINHYCTLSHLGINHYCPLSHLTCRINWGYLGGKEKWRKRRKWWKWWKRSKMKSHS